MYSNRSRDSHKAAAIAAEGGCLLTVPVRWHSSRGQLPYGDGATANKRTTTWLGMRGRPQGKRLNTRNSCTSEIIKCTGVKGRPNLSFIMLSLTAITFAISPNWAVLGMSLSSSSTTTANTQSTTAIYSQIKSIATTSSTKELVAGDSEQPHANPATHQHVIPSPLNVNLSAVPTLIAGISLNTSRAVIVEGAGETEAGVGLQTGVAVSMNENRSRNISNDNRTSSPPMAAAALTNETASPSPAPSWTRPPISLLQGFLASIFCMLIVLTVIGNTLVILSVLTTRRLRTVTNCFVMSLAVADWLVGLFVMPPAVAVFLLDKWQLGRVLCDIWISLDVLLCTASILSLCAISIDRYLAVTQPLNYSRRRRSKRLALLMILVVWVLAVAITCPPMLGWYDSAERGSPEECHYNQNKAYVVYSAMGSFFIPMLVMIYVYVQISCVIARRHDHMSEIEVHKKGHRSKEAELEIDVDNVSEPEPSSPRRINSNAASRSKQEVVQTSSGGSNASSTNNNNNSSSNFNKNYKNAQYELVDSGGASHTQAHHHQPPHQSRTMSGYRNSGNNKANSSESWYNSTSSNGPTAPNNAIMTSSCGSNNHNNSTTSSGTTNTIKTNNIRVHQKSMSNRILSLKRENKTTQTLAIVVGGFIACWLPFFIAYLVTPFLAKDAIDDGVSAFLTWLGWFNSAMNPFIYALYSVDFRAAFWRLTCRRFCKNMRKAPYASNTYSIRRT